MSSFSESHFYWDTETHTHDIVKKNQQQPKYSNYRTNFHFLYAWWSWTYMNPNSNPRSIVQKYFTWMVTFHVQLLGIYKKKSMEKSQDSLLNQPFSLTGTIIFENHYVYFNHQMDGAVAKGRVSALPFHWTPEHAAQFPGIKLKNILT